MVRELVPNPPWASDAIADAYETMQRTFRHQPLYLPELSAVWPSAEERGALTAVVQEFGCGAYGCVYPTLDPKTVIKVTTDDTEAQFAERYANDLVVPICVHYHAVMPLGSRHDGREIYLLWRESAEHVGQIAEVVSAQHETHGTHSWESSWIDEDAVYDAINLQHDTAGLAYRDFFNARGVWSRHLEQRINDWLHACEQMARIPELSHIGLGMIKVYREQGILFGDVHDGNLGMVTRDDVPAWVITDPGHIGIVRR